MADRIEKILDKCLARLKAGETVEDCLRDFPEYKAELEALLLAADSLNSVPKVSVSEDFRRLSYARLMARIRQESRPQTAPRFRIPVFNRITQIDWRPLIPAAMIALLVLTIWLFRPKNIPSTINANEFTLSVLAGNTETRSADSNAWQEAGAMSELSKGAAVRTSAGAYAVITFFDGSTVELDPETEVEVIDSSFPDGQSAHIVLNQLSGKTWNHVIGNGKEQPYYEVQTPQVTLVAQGTSFSSEIEDTGATNPAVIEGTVKVTDKQDIEISVAKDQQLYIESNLTAASPVNIPAVKNELSLSVGPSGVSSVCGPNGASTGLLPNGITFNQIPNSKVALTDNEQTIEIQKPVPGEYIITVRPIDQGDVVLGIQLILNDKLVYQNKIILPATSGDGWTVHFNIAAPTSVSLSNNVISIEPLTGKSPESVVQMPLAIQRATSGSAAATTKPTSTGKTTTTTTKTAPAATQVTTTVKPAPANILPQNTVTTPTKTTVVTTPSTTKTPPETTPGTTVPPNVTTKPTGSTLNSIK